MTEKMHIAHECSNCGEMVFIEDDDTFTDKNGKKIVDCPNCGKRLTILRGLRDLRAILNDPFDEDLEG